MDRAEVPGLRFPTGRIVNLAIGDGDDAGQALARHVGECALERSEKQGAVFRTVQTDPDNPDLEIAQRTQFFPNRCQSPGIQFPAPVQFLAGRFVDDDNGNVRQRLAIFDNHRWVRQNRQKQRRRQGAKQDPAGFEVKSRQDQGCGGDGEGRQRPPGQEWREGDRGAEIVHRRAAVTGRAALTGRAGG